MTKSDEKEKLPKAYMLVDKTDDDEGGSADDQPKSDGICQFMD